MSSQSSAIDGNIFLSLVAWSILYYDYSLTLSMEYEQFWKHQGKLSLASALFVLNRYISLLGEIPIILYLFGKFDTAQCHWLQIYHQTLMAATQGPVATLLFIRTYALYDRSKRVLLVLGFAFLTGLVTTIWSVASSNTSVNISSIKSSALQGCELPLTTRQADFLIAPWCSMLLFDAIVFLLTLRRSVQVIQLSGASGRMFQIMLRDGTIYFGALVILNTLNILTFLLVNPSGRGMASTLTNVMASILVSRLMLNLRDPSIGQYPHLSEVNIETTEQIISTNIFTMDLSEGGYSRESKLRRNV